MRPYRPIYKLCIVGAGPSGCYLAKSLLMKSKKEKIAIKIDLLESLDKPFGLLRYGVAPDKHDLKKSISSIDNSLFKKYSDNIKFYGNLTLGHDIKIEELKRKYDVVVLAVGGSQSFHTLPVKYMSNNLLNKIIGGVFSSRDWVFYYNNHPIFKNMLYPSKHKNSNLINNLNGKKINMDIELNYLKKKNNQFFEYKSPVSSHEISIPFKNENEDFKYGYGSDILRSYILNSCERNAVIVGNGNVSLDITRILSFYTYEELSKNKYLNPDFLNLINTSDRYSNSSIYRPLFKNIFVIGRRGWIHNSFKYPLLKEFIDKSRRSKYNLINGTNIRVMMSQQDFELSQDRASLFELDKSSPDIKRKYLKMKPIFQEMVNNHHEYINNNSNIFHNDKTINIHFKNLHSPINIETEQVDIPGNDGEKKSIPFIKGIEFARNIYNSEPFSNKTTLNEKEKFYLPCQLLITSLGFKPKYDYIFDENKDNSFEDNNFPCPVFKTGWMETNSKGDLNIALQNSQILSEEILNLLKKIHPKNV
ncbi:NADPH ferredoxin oxidoreductase [Cryptosporidium sp. chipmunk genotype I]|uniref:NADPH ferredoxin oxidoreductase n=1 Tax=Cryptosporidium sp. chipmunk genotype I TaxID=1280935 RepID=UPI00351A46D4|nr:NADPH ferredoxin oxidoreductase [Cryptosporidium sp. chipmunk genotype I]